MFLNIELWSERVEKKVPVLVAATMRAPERYRLEGWRLSMLKIKFPKIVCTVWFSIRSPVTRKLVLVLSTEGEE